MNPEELGSASLTIPGREVSLKLIAKFISEDSRSADFRLSSGNLLSLVQRSLKRSDFQPSESQTQNRCLVLLNQRVLAEVTSLLSTGDIPSIKLAGVSFDPRFEGVQRFMERNEFLDSEALDCVRLYCTNLQYFKAVFENLPSIQVLEIKNEEENFELGYSPQAARRATNEALGHSEDDFRDSDQDYLDYLGSKSE
jgi:hypothetical protein